MTRTATEMGFTPSARSKVSIVGNELSEDGDWDDFV